MEPLEIELKFFVPEGMDMSARLASRGARCTGSRVFEYNVRYETADDRLIKHRCLLRLRRDRVTTLTFKAPPDHADDRFKVYRELEVQVSDFATMAAILAALGFTRRQVYEKWRETWRLNQATLCVDTLPFGTFLEIEGVPETITATMADLGLAWEKRILHNYLKIFETLCEQAAVTPGDLTFDALGSRTLRFEPYRHLFEAGTPMPAAED